jgi:4-hydroxy 2-oxovalerate aldolase
MGEEYNKIIGIHAHDNMKMAYANTVEAMINGASMLDATVSCMGRGAGNCAMELLMSFLRNPKYNIIPVLQFIEDYMVPLKAKGDAVWGYDVPYMITGSLNQHPRDAIAFIKEKKTGYAEMYKEVLYRE